MELDLTEIFTALISAISAVSCSWLLYKTSKETTKKEDPKDITNIDLAKFILEEVKRKSEKLTKEDIIKEE